MHIITFLFTSVEVVIFFYLLIYRLARPDDKTTTLNIILIFLMIVYNLTGGLLPDDNLPGSFFLQMALAYGTGFITPCYFPYYVYKAFGLEKMRFHAYWGVYYFLILPYFVFVTVLAISGDLHTAKYLLVLPVVYAIWVIISLVKSIVHKYADKFNSGESKEEIAVLILSIVPWVGLPVIDFFNTGQVVEASFTNIGFLLLFGLHLKRNIRRLRIEHQRLIDSELWLQNWNELLQQEVDSRTKDLERMTGEMKFNKSCERYRLTNREKEIARLIREGYTHKAIGEALFISERTVAKHAQNIFEKTRVSNKIELCHKLGM
jgi:DNA-binding CsgD family transcriptional regulator